MVEIAVAPQLLVLISLDRADPRPPPRGLVV
jgi:hypothetical protein